MFRVSLASVLIASVVAERVLVGSHKFGSKFGATCDQLEATFHNRVGGLQALLDANSDENHFSTPTQVRLMVKSYGIIRTLRRAHTCSWVVDGNSDDIEQVQAIVQTLIAENPCGEVAQQILADGSSAETAQTDVQSVWRALSVLGNENCEVELYEETDKVHLDDEDAVSARLADIDAQAQDNIDEMVEEMENSDGSALVETTSDMRMLIFRSVMRTLGVVLLMVVLLLACTSSIAIISAMIALAISRFTVAAWCPVCRDASLAHAFHAVMFGFVPGFAVGFATCSHQLFTKLLPRLTGGANVAEVAH